MSKLKDKRTALGLSQSELAASSGVSLRMIQHYEQGFKDINKAQVGTIVKLSRALGCKVEDLVD
jgi:transcriptional regulator with XRE-family HTH domain